jgi:HEPN domain-containing protein
MSPEDPVSEVSRQWLTEARSDLTLARIDKPALVSWEALCFHAQQAAEKGLKAVLVHFQVDFPRTHSIGELIGLLEGHDHPVPTDIQGAKGLTVYAVHTRYPFDGRGEPRTSMIREDLDQAIEIADRVLAWAESVIAGKPHV